jgi:hypothetical protein
MKELFRNIIIAGILILSGCTAKNKTDLDTNNSDSASFMEQPQDKTQMNDTLPIQATDTTQLHPDTVQH